MSQVTQSVLAPRLSESGMSDTYPPEVAQLGDSDYPTVSQFSVEDGLDGVGGVAHAGVHPEALHSTCSGEIHESS